VLVQRDIPDGGIGLYQRLRTVSVVHVPIDDEHLSPTGAPGVSSRDHNVVNQAKAHSSACQRMMSWRPHGGKGMPSAIYRVIHGGQNGSRSSDGGRPTVLIEHRIEKQNATSACTHRFQERASISRTGLAYPQIPLLTNPLEHCG
jgi:hypothetical protein